MGLEGSPGLVLLWLWTLLRAVWNSRREDNLGKQQALSQGALLD